MEKIKEKTGRNWKVSFIYVNHRASRNTFEITLIIEIKFLITAVRSPAFPKAKWIIIGAGSRGLYRYYCDMLETREA